MKQSPTWSDYHARLHKTIRQRRLLKKDSHLLIAVSGGQDSLCLLKLLIDLRKKWNWTLAVAHCDHRWSTDNGISDRVEYIAQQWQLPFYLKIAEVVTETEAAAREWRYQALIDIATEIGFEQILTGHTQSDRAETMLYNLMRGAGANGFTNPLLATYFNTNHYSYTSTARIFSSRDTRFFARDGISQYGKMSLITI